MSSINNTGAALTLNPQAIACVAACIGSSLGLAILKDHTIAGTLATFAEDCRAVFCADAGVKASTGFATLQKLKPAPKGLSTFYSYMIGLRRMLKEKRTEAEILKATAREVTGQGSAEGKAKTPRAQRAEAPTATPLSVADCVEFLRAAHKAGMLCDGDYAALASIRQPVRQPVDMGPAVMVAPALPAPAVTLQ